MPERGGSSTQSGIYYQNSVAALYLGRLCDDRRRSPAEQPVSVRIEAPQEVDDTVITFADGGVLFIQSKESLESGKSSWKHLWEQFTAQFDRADFVRERDRLRLQLGKSAAPWDALRDLCDRARDSQSAEEWKSRLEGPQKDALLRVQKILSPSLSGNEPALWKFLAHIEVETWTLASVERDFAPHWMPEVTVTSATIFSLLRDRAGGYGRRRATFNARDLRASLRAENEVDFRAAPDIETLRLAFRAAGALLRQHKNTIGSTGLHLERTIVADIVAWAGQPHDQKNVALLLDHAGMGKTVIVRDVLHSLEESGYTALAIKADQQLSGVRTTADLQQRLALPAAVDACVSRLAVSERVVVIIDQIDALSLSLARDQGALDVVLDLIGRLRGLANVSVVASCRTFDRNTNLRLNRLEIDQEFTVAPLTDETVMLVLDHIGIGASELAPATRELLRTPLHLDLFVTVAERPGYDGASLSSVISIQQLYGQLWELGVLRDLPGEISPQSRHEVLQRISERMNREQRTSVARSTVLGDASAPLTAAADALASMGILVYTPTEVTFLHQTFFDYCFARFFVEGDKRIAEEVLASEQGMFARSQLIQVLAYLRGANEASYLSELSTLLAAENLRIHLRELVLRWLGAVSNPTDGEWRVAQRLLSNSETVPRVLRAFGSNRGWLLRVRERLLPRCLEREAGWVDQVVVAYLWGLAESAQAEVVDIIAPWLDSEDPWPARAREVLRPVRSWHSPEARRLLCRVLETAPFHDLRWRAMELIGVAALDPADGVRGLAVVLARVLQAHRRENRQQSWRGIAEELSELGEETLEKLIMALAAQAPWELLITLIDWLDEASGPAPNDDERMQWYFALDAVTPFYGTRLASEADFLIDGMAQCLEKLASGGAGRFRLAVQRLADSPWSTSQIALARAFTALGASHASDAVVWLLSDARRLRLGEDAQYSRELIQSIAPHVNAAEMASLESLILENSGLIPSWDRTVRALNRRGRDQLLLLDSVPAARLSVNARSRQAQLRRKHPFAAPREFDAEPTVGWGGSPIASARLDRMPDEAWLSAMSKYSAGVRGAGALDGGAEQLANELGARAKVEPARFAALALRAPDQLERRYKEALLRGVSDSEEPPDAVFEIVRRFALSRDSDFARAAATALGKCVRRGAKLPQDMADLLRMWMQRGAGPDETISAQNDGGDPHFAYMNSDRGAALEALIEALREDGSAEAIREYWDWMRFIVTDGSLALRAGAVNDLTAMLRSDEERAVSVFEQLVGTAEEMRKSPVVHQFLYWACYRRFERFGPMVEWLMDASQKKARQRGAELATVYHVSSAALESEPAKSLAARLVEKALTGSPEWREGAAKVFAHNAVNAQNAASLMGLKHLLYDEEKDVRHQVARVVDRLRGGEEAELRQFLLSFAASPSLWPAMYKLSEHLREEGQIASEWAIAMVETIIQNEHAPEDRWAPSRGAENLVRLVMQLVVDPLTSRPLQARAMDVFDQLMERFAGEAQKTLDEWDRR